MTHPDKPSGAREATAQALRDPGPEVVLSPRGLTCDNTGVQSSVKPPAQLRQE